MASALLRVRREDQQPIGSPASVPSIPIGWPGRQGRTRPWRAEAWARALPVEGAATSNRVGVRRTSLDQFDSRHRSSQRADPPNMAQEAWIPDAFATHACRARLDVRPSGGSRRARWSQRGSINIPASHFTATGIRGLATMKEEAASAPRPQSVHRVPPPGTDEQHVPRRGPAGGLVQPGVAPPRAARPRSR